MITKHKKKLTPASIASQKKWSSLPVTQKSQLRKILPDKDKDGVPNKYDCHPKNKRRQESFLPTDAAFLNTNPEIKLGKKIGNGAFGDIYSVANNRNLVIKVPRYFIDKDNVRPTDRVTLLTAKLNEIDEEAKLYNNNDLNDEPLFIPTKIVDIGRTDCASRSFVGLVRPKIMPLTDKTKNVNPQTRNRMTDASLIDLRKKVLDLSHKGYAIWDGLQVGMDKAGRILLYDVGIVTKYRGKDDMVFKLNNEVWLRFLRDVGRTNDFERYGGALRRDER